jgi:hypothetical protein
LIIQKKIEVELLLNWREDIPGKLPDHISIRIVDNNHVDVALVLLVRVARHAHADIAATAPDELREGLSVLRGVNRVVVPLALRVQQIGQIETLSKN